MAKKKGKAPEAEGAEEGEAKPAKSRKPLILGAAGVLLLGAAGGGYWFLAHRGGPAEPVKAAPKPVAFLDIREMVVNLAPEPNQERARYLKLKVALELKDAKVVPEIQPLLPRVEDTLQVFVRELRPSDLEASAGLYRLREELLRRVNVAVYPAKAEAVLFKDIVLQ